MPTMCLRDFAGIAGRVQILSPMLIARFFGVDLPMEAYRTVPAAVVDFGKCVSHNFPGAFMLMPGVSADLTPGSDLSRKHPIEIADAGRQWLGKGGKFASIKPGWHFLCIAPERLDEIELPSLIEEARNGGKGLPSANLVLAAARFAHTVLNLDFVRGAICADRGPGGNVIILPSGPGLRIAVMEEEPADAPWQKLVSVHFPIPAVR